MANIITPQFEDLSVRLRGVLSNLGITTTEQLANRSKEWICTLSGLERTSYKQLLEWEAKGMVFKAYHEADLSWEQADKLRLILQRLSLEEKTREAIVTRRRAAKRKRRYAFKDKELKHPLKRLM